MDEGVDGRLSLAIDVRRSVGCAIHASDWVNL